MLRRTIEGGACLSSSHASTNSAYRLLTSADGLLDSWVWLALALALQPHDRRASSAAERQAERRAENGLQMPLLLGVRANSSADDALQCAALP